MRDLLTVFYAPGTLFAGLPERKRAWVAPLIANCVLVVLLSYLVPHFMGREAVMRQQLAGFKMPPEQMQAALAKADSPGQVYGGYVAAVVVGIVILMGTAVALLAFGMMTARPPRFATMLSMVSLAMFPYWLVGMVITTLVLMTAADPASLNLRNLIATNVGAYLDPNTTSKGLYSLMSSIDILSFVEIGLLAYGFSKLTRVSFFFGLAAVMGLWVLYVSSKMALSLLF